MNTIKRAILAAGILLGIAVTMPSIAAFAATPGGQVMDGLNSITDKTNGAPTSFTSLIQTGVKVLLFIIGALAVVMIVFSGFKYITSGGDATAVTSAKNTLLYAVIGLVVAILAYAVVNFVVKSFQPSPTKGGSGAGNTSIGDPNGNTSGDTGIQ